MSADLLLGIPAQMKKLLDRMTQARADSLDNLANLDTAVSSRASSTDTGTLLGRMTSTRSANLDRIPLLPTMGPFNGRYLDGPSAEMVMGANPPLGMFQQSGPFTIPSTVPFEGITIATLSGKGVIGFFGLYNHTTATSAFTLSLAIDGLGHIAEIDITAADQCFFHIGYADANMAYPFPMPFYSGCSLRIMSRTAGSEMSVSGIWTAYAVD